jgi:hypothetical protein
VLVWVRTMKRVVWTLGMTFVGLGLGWHSQGARYEPENVAAIKLWFGGIGFGFGSTFSKRRPSDGLFIFYRAFTLALIGVFFFPFVPLSQFAAQVVIAGLVGALLGAVMGFAQLRLSKQQVRK